MSSLRRKSKLLRAKTITSFGSGLSEDEESGPRLSENGTIPRGILTMDSSFGYNCRKPYNLYLLGSDVLVFLSGNLIHFLNTTTLQITFRRSTLGSGIGCITKNAHPDYNYLTIGENGENNPPIFIYKYPEMELKHKLVGGAKKIHTRATYTADGQLLASQSGSPDFVITIWKWEKSEIVIRLQSSSKDVYNLKFSSFSSELLTSGGAGHIKFWKMCNTFTGLKLNGESGRFGMFETSDIYGIFQLEDGKVLSGSDWGNILVWENHRIKYEVFRKNHKTCHTGPITQIIWNNQDVLTVSLDGYVRLWFWETVESSCPTENERFLEVEPIYEFKIGNEKETCQLMSMVKSCPDDPKDQKWFVQDGNGGIWSCDLTPNPSGASCKQLYRCHAGPIVSAATSPFSCHITTLGSDGRLHVYDYDDRKLIYYHQFISKGSAMIWLPISIAPLGNCLVLAFESGVLRVIIIIFEEKEVKEIKLIQILKCHTRAITQISINKKESILVSGSDDHTIVINEIIKLPNGSINLNTIGLVPLSSMITALNWVDDQPATVLVGCRFGEVFEIKLPETTLEETKLSYELKDLPIREVRFRSKKSEIKRLIKMKNIWYDHVFNPNKEEEPINNICEDDLLFEQEKSVDSHYIPPIPNKILWLKSAGKDRVWISMAQFDAGFIYEYDFLTDEPTRFIPIPGCPDFEINSYLYTPQYLIFGMSNGVIRITKLKDNPYDIDDFWELGMHDNENGAISQIVFSFDKKFLFTTGADGNLFSYNWNGTDEEPLKLLITVPLPDLPEVEDFVDDRVQLSVEEEKRKLNDDQRHTICDANKNKVLKVIDDYRVQFKKVWSKNQSLPKSQRIGDEYFMLDQRIAEDLKENLERQMNLTKIKMAYDFEKARIRSEKLKTYFIEPMDSFPIQVIGIKTTDRVKSFRICKLKNEFYNSKLDLENRLILNQQKDITRRESMSVEFTKNVEYAPLKQYNEEEVRVHRIESFLREMGESKKFSNLQTKMRRLLKKYKERKGYEADRKREWDLIHQEKPNPDVNHPDDVTAIAEAEITIGDYKLKISPNYEPPENGNNTLLKKFGEILNVREEIYSIRKIYNDKVMNLRDKKISLLNYIRKQQKILDQIHSELPTDFQKPMAEFNQFDENVEFPERNLYPGKQLKLNSNDMSKEMGLTETVDDFERQMMNESWEGDWEFELRQIRIDQNKFAQENLLSDINNQINGYDKELKSVSEEMLEIELKVLFLETFLLTLVKEFFIIRDFYEEEISTIELVDEKSIENSQFLSKILSQETALDQTKRNIVNCKEEKRIVQQKFESSCLDNKFTDFLKWIFEKSEDEIHTTDSLQNESDYHPSSSESERSNSINSSNYDETICPSGCDRELYDLAFQLRDHRFALDRQILEENQNYERIKVDLDFLTQEIKSIQKELAARKLKYLSIRQRKQKLLNEVDTLVILRLDQLQYFKNEVEFKNISNILLFNQSNLMKLHARIGQIAVETMEIKRKHRVNIVFLSRLKTDCHYMEEQIQELKDKIKDAMMKKFGMTVNLDELQEALLKKLLFDIRLNIDDVRGEFNRKIGKQKRILSDKEMEYTKVIQEGTEKLNILTVLQEEKNQLEEILCNQLKLRKKMERKKTDFSNDIEKMKEISRDQVLQIETLQREIRTLSLKCKPFSSSVPTLPAIGQNINRSEVIEFSDKEFEGSIYASVVDSVPNSARDIPVDDHILTEILKAVMKFLKKNLQSRLAEKQIRILAQIFTNYFGNVAKTFDCKRKDELVPCIIEDIHSLLPKDFVALIPAKDISNLFEKIFVILKSTEEFELKDIVFGIVENSVELVNVSQEQNYSQSLIVELFRQFFATIPLSEMKEDTFLDEVLNALADVKNIQTQDLDMDGVIGDVEDFLADNSTEDLELEDIRDIVKRFFNKYQENT